MGLYRDADGLSEESRDRSTTEKASYQGGPARRGRRLPGEARARLPGEDSWQAHGRGVRHDMAAGACPLTACPVCLRADASGCTSCRPWASRVLANVTTADIRRYFRTLEAQGTSQALGKKIKTVMSAMFQTAAEDGLIPANVVRGVRFQAAPPKRRRALTADEWCAVRRYLTGEHRLLADVQMATGARIEEIRGMDGRGHHRRRVARPARPQRGQRRGSPPATRPRPARTDTSRWTPSWPRR